MRTVEILFVVIIILGAFIIASFFAVLPMPSQVSPLNFRRLASTTLQILDANYHLSETVFKPANDSAWGEAQIALSACLPPNVVFNLTVYEIVYESGQVTYQPRNSLSNSKSGLGVYSDAASYFVASSKAMYTQTPEKIGTKSGKNVTLYILNCADANGWWITGYTGQSLAQDLYSMLWQYFETTILVNNTYQLGSLLNCTKITALQAENVTDAVVINTFGEAVPIPDGYYTTIGQGSGYANYSYTLGHRVRQYNWTWVSIVGYPFYYVTNTVTLKDLENSYGIYGMSRVGPAGLNAFLAGIDNQVSYGSSGITSDIGLVQATAEMQMRSDYYGIYPSSNPSASRALPQSIEQSYHLTREAALFEPKNGYVATATFRHTGGGALTAIGLTRTPDIRVAALALLMYYQPSIYKSQFGVAETSLLVVLQIAQQGGV